MVNNILVFGASGQLGNCINAVCRQDEIADVFFPSETDANILDTKSIELLFKQHKPAFCINCAAYTAVDKAEDDIDTARKINRTGAANLAEMCKQYGTVLIHVSTDFVFEGNIPQLLKEEDVAAPTNIYGLTKLEGEQDIVALWPKHYIIRTSWLYSEYGNNFVKTMIKLAETRDELKIIADQVGTPTYAIDLAKAILAIIASGKANYGIYHYSNEGVASWYDFAKAIFELSGTKVKVLPVKTTEYVTKAVRPAFSVMDKTKIKNTFGLSIPYWKDSLKDCINILKK